MNNKRIVIASVLVAVLVVAVLTATYVYFQARIGTESITNTIVTLKARNDASASYNYKVCLNITENTFAHSQISSTETSNGRTANLYNGQKVFTSYPIMINTYEALENYIGQTATVSFDLKVSETGVFGVYQYQSNGIGIKVGNLKVSMIANETQRVSLTGIVAELGNVENYSKGQMLVYKSGYTGSYYADNIQIELGDHATAYEEYGYIENEDLELTVIKNGTAVLTKDITHGTEEICIPTTNGRSTTTHTIGASAGPTTTDTWNATVTFKNYNNNRNINLDKIFNSNFVFTRI